MDITPPDWLKNALPERAKAILRPLYHRISGTQSIDYTEAEVALLPLLVPSGREAVDVGANQGMYTRRLAEICPLVHAYEPVSKLAARLAKTCPGNVRVNNMALSDRAGTAVLRIPVTGGRALHGLATVENRELDTPSVIDEQVSCGCLDDLAGRDIGFVKIDVEGHEGAVLEGGRALIRRRRPLLLIEAEERHRPGAIESLRRFLAAEGYFGWFVLGRRTYDISELSPEMTDPERIGEPVDRCEVYYVANYFFSPSSEERDRMRASVDRHFNAADCE